MALVNESHERMNLPLLLPFETLKPPALHLRKNLRPAITFNVPVSAVVSISGLDPVSRSLISHIEFPGLVYTRTLAEFMNSQ